MRCQFINRSRTTIAVFAQLCSLLLFYLNDLHPFTVLRAAVQAFQTRTCYGNASNDHIVGWANSTLRYADELPELNLRDRIALPTAKGVVHEDPLEYSWLLPDDVPSSLPSQSNDTATITPVGVSSAGRASKKPLERVESTLRTALADVANASQHAVNAAVKTVEKSAEKVGLASSADDPATGGGEDGQGEPGPRSEVCPAHGLTQDLCAILFNCTAS
jgi:hypothetical protein